MRFGVSLLQYHRLSKGRDIRVKCPDVLALDTPVTVHYKDHESSAVVVASYHRHGFFALSVRKELPI